LIPSHDLIHEPLPSVTTRQAIRRGSYRSVEDLITAIRT